MDRTDVSAPPGISLEELQLATRNHGMPLEALVHDVTPIGLHYLLTHYDIPAIDPEAWCSAGTSWMIASGDARRMGDTKEKMKDFPGATPGGILMPPLAGSPGVERQSPTRR